MPKRDLPAQFGAILIADDHEVFRFGLSEVLRRALGASRVVGAGGFDEAVKHLTEPDLRLAIFDLGMPGLVDPRGLTVVRQRRPDLRVIVISASDKREDILASLEAGAHGYIVKSDSTDVLLLHVRHVLSGEIYVPPAIADLPPEPAKAKRNGRSGDARLTRRQLQVLELVTEGHSNKEISARLKISEGTVKMHISATCRAIGANNRTQAAAIGRKFLS